MLRYKEIDYILSESNVKVIDSWKITDKDVMLDFINNVVLKLHGFDRRSVMSYYREWKAHNFLYNHNKFVDRTKDTDLNYDESWLRRICYFFLAVL